jgi:hypothetical protein
MKINHQFLEIVVLVFEVPIKWEKEREGKNEKQKCDI